MRALIGLLALVGAFVVLVVALGATGVLHLYRTPSSSMEPTFHCARPGAGCQARSSDRVVVVRYLFGSPKRGDLVAFRTPPLAAVRCGAGGTFLKRIVGLPGERVAERDGTIFIDGTRLREPYVPSSERDSRSVAATTVASGHYWVLGDNRSSSCDSRAWGSVARRSVIGKVYATYCPPGRIAVR